MKVVIPYREFHGQELKYCLRGIEKFIEDPEITIIGDRPKWVKNITHIPFKDHVQHQFRSKNIYDKIMLVDYDFLFFNDDHFLLQPFSADTYHYSGRLMSEVERTNISGPYKKTIQNTINLFGNIKNFDTHCPIFYERKVLDALISLDWNKAQGYCIKSVYAHLAGIAGTPYPDLKIRKQIPEKEIKQLIEGRPYFSTGNYCFGRELTNVLEEIFPFKSNFEL